jgi:hypothetical protein
MANFANDLGSIEVGSQAVGEVLAYSWDGADVGVIEDTIKGETVRTFKSGRVDLGTFTITAQFDYGDTNGQKVLLDDVIAGTGTSLTVDLISDTGKEINLTGFATGVSVENAEGEGIQQATYVGKVTAASVAWV